QGQVSDDIGNIPLVLHLFPVADHRRIVILTLAGKNFPVIEPGRVSHQMPFADQRSLIARSLQQLWESSLRAIEAAIYVVEKAIDMIVGARQHRGAAWAADGIGHQTPVEAHSLLSQTVEIGRLDDL